MRLDHPNLIPSDLRHYAHLIKLDLEVVWRLTKLIESGIVVTDVTVSHTV